ncbi:hypothetical protein CHN50_02200 [Priestia aryabhattai]|nr:hypothetical protein CHN50_02200 [Priestia aryabhattai]
MVVKDLFTETKKVIADYKAESEKLDQQERELNAELAVLQEEMTNNILDQETATVSELVYLKISAKEIVQKTEIIKVLLEELAEERTALKLEFTPIYRSAIRQDAKSKAVYNATEIVEKYRYQMLKEIADIGKQMQSQYHEIAPDVYEVFEDIEVKKEFPRLEYVFNQEQFEPYFGWLGDSVVHKNDVFVATRGYMPDGVKEPKEKDVE